MLYYGGAIKWPRHSERYVLMHIFLMLDGSERERERAFYIARHITLASGIVLTGLQTAPNWGMAVHLTDAPGVQDQAERLVFLLNKGLLDAVPPQTIAWLKGVWRVDDPTLSITMLGLPDGIPEKLVAGFAKKRGDKQPLTPRIGELAGSTRADLLSLARFNNKDLEVVQRRLFEATNWCLLG